jgi:hypothetical protein
MKYRKLMRAYQYYEQMSRIRKKGMYTQICKLIILQIGFPTANMVKILIKSNPSNSNDA